MSNNQRPADFWTWASEVYGKAKAMASKLQGAVVLFIACIVAYLTWLGFSMNDLWLKLVPVAIFVAGLIVCLFYYAWQAWKSEVETINEIREQRLFLHEEIDLDGTGHYRLILENPSEGTTIYACRVQVNNRLIEHTPLNLHCSGEQRLLSATVDLHPGEPRKFDIFYFDATAKTVKICAASRDDIFLTLETIYELTFQAFGQDVPPSEPKIVLLDMRIPGKPIICNAPKMLGE